MGEEIVDEFGLVERLKLEILSFWLIERPKMLAKRFPYNDLKIITFDEEYTIDIDNITISVMPIWKWL